MSIIKKDDLKYKYNWSTSPASKSRDLTTETDSKSEMFNAEDGGDVLSFINEYADSNEILDKEEALRIEQLLKEKMEKDYMTRNEAREWLNDYLKSDH